MPDTHTHTQYPASSHPLPYPAASVICLLAALLLLTDACANVMAPQGGPKDTKAPQIVSATPSHESTHFQGKELTLVFDKNIKFDPKKLRVTPKLEKRDGKPSYTHVTWGNKLILKLQVPLAPDTTYTFNFSGAVKDLTEGNVAQNVALTFSTGAQLDAMSVSGYVIYHMTNHLIPKACVMLYDAEGAEAAQKNILNSLPDYYCYTNEKGAFTLKHIRPGRYHIYAATGGNAEQLSTLKVDPGKDIYGFLREPIDLSVSAQQDIVIPILQADIRPLKLLGQGPQHQYFELRFNKPIKETYTLALARRYKRLQGDHTLYSHLVDNGHIIRVYNTAGLLEEESLQANLKATDAVLGNTVEQPVTIRFTEKRARHQTIAATYNFTPASGAAIKSQFAGTMRLNKPAKAVEADKISFVLPGEKVIVLQPQDLTLNAQRDVVTINKTLDFSLLANNSPKTSLKAQKGTQPAEEIALHIASGAFRTVEGDSNEDMQYAYTVKNPKAYGTIEGKVTTQVPGFIVQLLDMEYNVVDEVRNTPDYQFREVAPGNYRVRLLILADKDGEWRCGNLHERREPDPVRIHAETVGVVANWAIKGIDLKY